MIFSWETFLIGAVLGIIQFGVGLWIGKMIYDRRKQRLSSSSGDTSKEEATEGKTEGKEVQESAKRLQTVTARLQSTVNRVSSDVGNHQIRIEQMTRELHAFKKRSVSITEEVIWERLNQLLRMTTDFSNRLSDAESRIQVQAQQIDMMADSQQTLPGASILSDVKASVEEYAKKSGIQPVAGGRDSIYYPDTSESLITDETVDSVASLGSGEFSTTEEITVQAEEESTSDEPGKQTVPADESEEVDSVLENVRSRLSEVVSSRPSE